MTNKLNLYIQPYPLTDSNVVYNLEKEGLLYIGRHEDRKNPVEYFKVLKYIKDKYNVEIKANVMTRGAHVKKFEADFAEINHSNYEIVSDVVGEEKATIIQKSKVAFMPYKNESFGIAVLEALRFMPTVVLSKYDWHYNFKNFSNYISADSKNVAEVIWDAYNNHTVDESKVSSEFDEYQREYENSLLGLLTDYTPVANKQTPRSRIYNFLLENSGKWILLSDYFKTQNTKGVIYLTSDIESIYLNRSWYQVTHTADGTYLGIPDSNGNLAFTQPEKEIDSFSSFFD